MPLRSLSLFLKKKVCGVCVCSCVCTCIHVHTCAHGGVNIFLDCFPHYYDYDYDCDFETKSIH